MALVDNNGNRQETNGMWQIFQCGAFRHEVQLPENHMGRKIKTAESHREYDNIQNSTCQE